MKIHPSVARITDTIVRRSAVTRKHYLAHVDLMAGQSGASRQHLSCTNLAHGFAAAPKGDKILLRELRQPNLAIVSAYNEMLSAHQPFHAFPAWIKEAARDVGATAQFAGGVPAMCDGVTQGRPGMELSLFSRDVIAMATAIALTHDMFDAALCLGVCDKIVPGLLIGALSFGHLPAVFVPAGPMGSGLPNDEKARVRQRYAAGEVGREALLESEAKSYHSAGTCTFYGTANSNQMLMEVMGLHLPGAAFVHPAAPLREALTRAATRRAARITAQGKEYIPVGRMIDERSIVNAIVALLATGGSTNHTLHLVAIARAAGIQINWDDFSALSAIVPLLARVYPNGSADVNRFHEVGGTGFLIAQLLAGGLLHEDVMTVMGLGLARYTQVPQLAEDGSVHWQDGPLVSGDTSVLAPIDQPFSADGGLRLMQGNLGRAVIKVSAVKAGHRRVHAPARVFDSQEAMVAAAQCGDLDKDVVVVVRFQGPRANGMPELHSLTPTLANVQDKGYNVALVTDGRMSGASGKVLAAIHLTPECLLGGELAKVQDGDMMLVDADTGQLEVQVAAAEWALRQPAVPDLAAHGYGLGRELFGGLRSLVTGAEEGAYTFGEVFRNQG